MTGRARVYYSDVEMKRGYVLVRDVGVGLRNVKVWGSVGVRSTNVFMGLRIRVGSVGVDVEPE